MKVVILDTYAATRDDLDWSGVEALPDVELDVWDRTRPADTVARAREAEAVLTNKVVLDAATLEALPRLRYVGVLATGYNVVDTEAARRRGITVTNIPAYSTLSVAQTVVAHVLNVTNSVAHYAAERGRWPSSPDFSWADTPLTELAGKTFAVYGMGNIGTAVARIALALGMRVVAVTSRQPEALPAGVERTEWEQALDEADVLSLHCPLTPATHHLVDAAALARMKPSAILVNTGRGPLVDEQAVAAALGEGRLGAYCADVLSVEPPSPDNPLLAAPRCYLTPHIAWATKEARQRLVATATANLRCWLEGRPQNVVAAG